MLRILSVDGDVWVNPAHVAAVTYPQDKETAYWCADVHLIGGHTVHAQEPVEQLAQRIKSSARSNRR